MREEEGWAKGPESHTKTERQERGMKQGEEQLEPEKREAQGKRHASSRPGLSLAKDTCQLSAGDSSTRTEG